METNLILFEQLNMIGDIIRLVEVAGNLYPHEWKNIKADFPVDEIGLWFVCDDKELGYFRLNIYDRAGDCVAYLEGQNHQHSPVNIGHNSKNYSEDFLYNSFHMARCRREFERTGDINYSKGFDYYRRKVVGRRN